ncbi:MAG: hypothetical protein ACW985_04805 [Candidatus Thorarchaeota archaeon]|jgi:hypothetical protein
MLIRRIVVIENRLRKKHSGRVVYMTEIPMPDDYEARSQGPPKEEGCCERCCTCSLQVICAIILIAVLIFLILFAEVLFFF